MVIKVFPKHGPRIFLWLPLGAAKWRIFRHAIIKNRRGEADLVALFDSMPALVKAARQYVRRHGHFKLVEVMSHNGDYILIRV